MATLNQALQKARAISKDALISQFFDVIRSCEKEFIDKNKDQLLNEKIDIYGSPIGYYSRATEAINPNKRAGTPFTLYDTGDFFSGFYMEIQNQSVKLYSRDSKTKDLVGAHLSRYSTFLSGDIFGLTDKNLREVIEQSILPLFIQDIRTKLSI